MYGSHSVGNIAYCVTDVVVQLDSRRRYNRYLEITCKASYQGRIEASSAYEYSKWEKLENGTEVPVAKRILYDSSQDRRFFCKAVHKRTSQTAKSRVYVKKGKRQFSFEMFISIDLSVCSTAL